MSIDPKALYSYGLATRETFTAAQGEIDALTANLTDDDKKNIVDAVSMKFGETAKEMAWNKGFSYGALTAAAINVGGNPELGHQAGVIIADESKKYEPSWTNKLYYGFMAALEYIGITNSSAPKTYSANSSGFIDYLEKRGKELAAVDVSNSSAERVFAFATKYNPELASSSEFAEIKTKIHDGVYAAAIAKAFNTQPDLPINIAASNPGKTGQHASNDVMVPDPGNLPLPEKPAKQLG